MKIWEALDINREKEGVDVQKEIDEYEEVIKKLFHEEIHPERFRSYRLLFGTYGVRKHGEGMHMQRIKIPSGFILSEQLRVIADLTEKYAGSGHAHLTTRQDIQLHYVRLENIPTILRELAKVGITTREACGNSVRNITSSYLSGICPKEEFDTLPYAIFCSRYFLRFFPLSSTLPRKFKIAFSECQDDHAMVRMHDIGAVATVKRNGTEICGFKVYVGGGLGPVPMYAELFTEFIPTDEFYILAEAILKVFHEHGTEERKFRNKARMKFLIARIGFDRFKKLVMNEFEFLKKVKLDQIKNKLSEYVNNFPKPAPTKNGREDGEENEKKLSRPLLKPDQNDPLFKLFLEKYTFRQKQDGYFGVYVKPPLGNLKPDDLRFVASLCENYGAAYIRITPTQKILIPWVKEDFLYDAYTALKSQGFIGGVNQALREIVSCPGAFSCKLAVTHPYNLAEHIGNEIDDLHGLRIHISGCPNSCGQHHIGDIGFYGGSAKVGNKLSPHYIVLIGGNIFKQRARYGEVLGKIPAKNTSLFVREIVDLWKKERKDGEEFFEFVDRIGLDRFKEILAKHSRVDPNDPEIYFEPGIDEEFKMEAEARGECAGSLLDLMAVNLFDAYRNMYEIEYLKRAENFSKIKENLLDSILKCTKTYVYLEGEEPQTEEDILNQFESKILPKGWFCSDWSELKSIYYKIKETPQSPHILNFIDYVKGFVKDAEKAFLRLKPNLRIQECAKTTPSSEDD